MLCYTCGNLLSIKAHNDIRCHAKGKTHLRAKKCNKHRVSINPRSVGFIVEAWLQEVERRDYVGQASG